MASAKPDLARAGTMEVTAKDGKSFLDRNLTDWKKPYLMEDFEGDEAEAEEAGESSEEETSSPPSGKKARLSKHSTMKGTAKEAAEYLADKSVDEDVFTRGQQKTLDNIKAEKPKAKKAKLAKANTMVATAKEGKSLVGKEKLGDTRQVTKAKKGALKRASTADAVVSEAIAVYGDLDASEGRSLRKRPKTPLKKAGTMQNTAEEGKAFLKRSKKRGKKN